MDTEQTDKPTIPGSQGQAPSTPYYTLVANIKVTEKFA